MTNTKDVNYLNKTKMKIPLINQLFGLIGWSILIGSIIAILIAYFIIRHIIFYDRPIVKDGSEYDTVLYDDEEWRI